MKRTFLNTNSEPHQFVTVAAPFSEVFESHQGDWGGEERSQEHAFSSHVEAIEGYIAFVDELLTTGYFELSPWLAFRRGDDMLEVRPPVIACLETRTQGGEPAVERYDSHQAAIDAYNQLVAEHLADGFSAVGPTWEPLPEPLAAGFEEHVEYEDEEPDKIKKKYFRRREPPHDEFGPELWYEDGEPRFSNFQLATQIHGPSIEWTADGMVSEIVTYHDGAYKYGPTIQFSADGSLEAIGRCETTPVGSSRVVEFFSPSGQRLWLKKYDKHDELIDDRRYDEQGRSIGTWRQKDAENYITKVYQAPEVLESLIWERHDGTLEGRRQWNADGTKVFECWCDEDGSLVQRLVRHDDLEGWDYEEWHPGTEVLSEVGQLDAEGNAHGIVKKYDESGELSDETVWEHGETVSGGTSPTEEMSSAALNSSSGDSEALGDDMNDDAFYDLSDEMPEEDFETLFEQAKALAQGPIARAGFVDICQVVEKASVVDPERVIEELVPCLVEALDEWPARLRMAPWLWINRLVTRALPVEALELVSSLSLTAAMADRYLDSKHYPLLLAWLDEYPADGPAPEGISLSFRDEVAQALEAAREAEPRERYHPTGDLDFDQTYHFDSADMQRIFGSALLREVRVLDASFEPTRRDFGWDYQGILDGRGLTPAEVAEHLSSESLEVLDLWGQLSSPRNQFADYSFAEDAARRLEGLEALNLGGGHPVGDEAAKKLADTCPKLRGLSLRPGQAGELLDGYDFDEFDHSEGRDSVYGRIYEHWRVSGNADIDKMRLTDSGWQALSELPLERVTLGEGNANHGLRPDVQVEVLSKFDELNGPRVAAWEAYFDVS